MGFYGNKLINDYKETTLAKINIGICEGYNNDIEVVDDFEDYLYNKLEEISNSIDYYIPFVVYKTKTIYKKEWGCPKGGEKTYNIEATRNPKYEENDKIWREKLVEIISILKKELKQFTVTINFIKTEILYLNEDE